MRPKGLDVCCCEGGCSRGYTDAGADMYGIDLFDDYSRSRYPYPSYKGDAIAAMKILLLGGWLPFTRQDGVVEWLQLKDFAFLHGSPPCQRWSITNHNGRDYPDLITPLREAFIESGLPWVIENVIGAPLENPVELCGCMFNLTAVDDDGIKLHMWRQRQFESNLKLAQPRPGAQRLRGSSVAVHDEAFHDYEWVGGSYGGARRDKYEAKYIRKGGYVPSASVQQKLLGIDWMTQKGMHQSIPPAFTEFIGRQIMSGLDIHTEGVA